MPTAAPSDTRAKENQACLSVSQPTMGNYGESWPREEIRHLLQTAE